VHQYPDSNAWAADGPAVAGGGALLGGDPHLPQTLPSIWYQAALAAPGYDVSGVTVPGVPGVLLGHNERIAWSLTDTQNQAYPYYIGTTGDFFDPGYRASYSYAFLRAHEPLTMADVGALQTSLTDLLASEVVPRLVAAVHGGTPAQRAALSLLASWNYSMGTASAAATIWWTFWSDYLYDVFHPWWAAARVPSGRDGAGLTVSMGLVPLDEDLQAWTLGAPSGGAFSLPSGRVRDAASVMRAALDSAVASLSKSLGGPPSSWTWGRVHARSFPRSPGRAAWATARARPAATRGPWTRPTAAWTRWSGRAGG
jgi:penicillin G amidase